MRRLISPIIAVAVGGFLIGIAYRRFLDDPSGASVANYLRSGLHAMLIAVFGLAANLYFNVRASRWLRTWPIVAEIALRAVAMAIAIAAVIAALQVAIYDQPPPTAWLLGDFPENHRAFFHPVRRFWRGIRTRQTDRRQSAHERHSREVSPSHPGGSGADVSRPRGLDVFGGGAWRGAHAGASHALLLRHRRSDCCAWRRGARLCGRRGDRVLATLGRGPREAHVVDCFFAVKDRIEASADTYRREFGSVPRFRAALHAGPVVIGECGDSHRQIAYFGDSMNVTARLQEHCKGAGRSLLVSADLLKRVRPDPGLTVAALGNATLRGRSAAVEIFAVERGT